MTFWGVKPTNAEMRIVSTMAAAYLSFRQSPGSEVFKLEMDESGAYSVVDGPIEIVRKDGSLYGATSIKPYVIFHILFTMIIGFAVVQIILYGKLISLAVLWSAYIATHIIGNAEDRIQKETLAYYKKFTEDMRDLLGS